MWHKFASMASRTLGNFGNHLRSWAHIGGRAARVFSTHGPALNSFIGGMGDALGIDQKYTKPVPKAVNVAGSPLVTMGVMPAMDKLGAHLQRQHAYS